MNAPGSIRTCIAVLLASALASCGQVSSDDVAAPPAPSESVAPASASAPVIAAAATSTVPADHAATRHYKIAISLPDLPAGAAPLAQALRTTADAAKRDFLQSLPDPRQLPELANRQLDLRIDFKLAAATPAYLSVRETGMQDTGGAHPLPIEAAFVFDRKAGKLVTLDDLFGDTDAARKALANFAHDALLKKFMANAPKPGEGSSPTAIRDWQTNMQQMLADGTRPTSVNYSLFVVRAGASDGAASPGLTLVFPPYQVAPYSEGTQVVEVPASVFAKFLKPACRSAFVAN